MFPWIIKCVSWHGKTLAYHHIHQKFLYRGHLQTLCVNSVASFPIYCIRNLCLWTEMLWVLPYRDMTSLMSGSLFWCSSWCQMTILCVLDTHEVLVLVWPVWKSFSHTCTDAIWWGYQPQSTRCFWRHTWYAGFCTICFNFLRTGSVVKVVNFCVVLFLCFDIHWVLQWYFKRTTCVTCYHHHPYPDMDISVL